MTHLRIPPALILDLGNGVEMSFQSIPAGSFRMGSRGCGRAEEPIHQVTISKPFYLATFLVTQKQFAQWKPGHKYRFPGYPQLPAERIDWNEANQYCSWLTEVFDSQLPFGYVAGLPTEAQWEFACRAGTDTEYYTGEGEAALAMAGWFEGNSQDQIQPVGQLEENALGLFDMHGSIWEWCADAWDAHTYKKRVHGVCDPFTDGKHFAERVFRGGSWNYPAGACSSSSRDGCRPDYRDGILGFRVCLFLGPRPGQASKPKRDRAASEILDDFSEASFPGSR